MFLFYFEGLFFNFFKKKPFQGKFHSEDKILLKEFIMDKQLMNTQWIIKKQVNRKR